MIEFFRRNVFFNSLMLLPYTVLIRIKSILQPQAYDLKPWDGYLNDLLYSSITSPLLQNILAILLIFIQAAFLNRIVVKNRLTHEQTLIPGVMLIILHSILPPFLVLSPIIIANFFILISLSEIMGSYKKYQNSTHIYNAGFMVGLASLFFLPYLTFFLVALAGFLTMGSFKVVKRLQLLLGTLTPIYLLAAWLYFNGNLSTLYPEFLKVGNGLIFYFTDFNIPKIILIATITLISLSAVLSYYKFTMKKSIQAQKKIDIFYWALMAAVIAGVITYQFTDVHILLFSLPLAMFVALYLLKLRSGLVPEIIHIGMLGLLYSLHFNLLDQFFK